jgi:hypothetical protein
MDQNSGTSKLGLMETFTQKFKPLLKHEKAYGIDRIHTLCGGQTGLHIPYSNSLLDGPGFEYLQGLELFSITVKTGAVSNSPFD